MSDFTYHAVSSVNAFGGVPEDYYAIHQWIDRGRSNESGPLHRMLCHHTQGIQDCVEHFGPVITNSRGRKVPTQLLAEQHIREDLGFVPSMADWVSLLYLPRWASRPAKLLHSKLFDHTGTQTHD